MSEQVNKSGILPVEYKVLVKTDNVEDVSDGGIYLGNKQTERETLAQTSGTLIDVGGNAFEDWKGKLPEPGDRVMTAKYAGGIVEGVDGEEYRLMNDKDIAAIIFGE